MNSIAIFCGAGSGNDPSFTNAVTELGQRLAEQKITVIYGGAKSGLMGTLADAVLRAGGRVVGVMPIFLKDKEIAHPGLTEIVFCESMHERKKKMFELSEGFIALPGGFGTLDEIFEILSWRQLGFHHSPVGFLNVAGFFDHLIAFFDRMEESKLLRPEARQTALFSTDISTLIAEMKMRTSPLK